jgi:hypothetical protein
VDEDFIAEVRNKFKITYFLYKRKKCRWLELYQEVKDLTLPVEEIPEDFMKRENLGVLKPKPKETKWLYLFRFLSILSIILAVVVLSNQAIALIKPEYSPVYYLIEKENPG